MSLDVIPPFPWFLNKPIELAVNDQPVMTRIVSSEWTSYWRPLMARLREIWLAAQPGRLLVGIGGPPGTGKSVLAEQLNWLIFKGFMHKDAHSVALPMDGFHFPNAYLEQHTRKLPDGAEVPLNFVKGAPDTINAPDLKTHLERLRQRPKIVEWPGYSRFAHDVVQNKFRIPDVANIIFVDGNYLLVDRGPFHGIPALFDLKIYVETPAPHIIAQLVDRHVKGGKTIDQAKDWVKRIDLPNARIAESTRHHADVIIERNTENEISGITWQGANPEKHQAPESEPVA